MRERTDGRPGGQKDGRMEGRMDGRIDRWMDGWTDISKSPCVLQDISPLGRLPKKGNGWTDGWMDRWMDNPLITRSVTFEQDRIQCNPISLRLAFLGSGPKGVNDQCFHTHGDFLLLLLHPPPQILVSRPKFWSRAPNPSLEAQIPASRPKF